MEHIEERVQEAPVPFAVAGVDLDGMPVEVVELIQSVVFADRRRLMAEHAEEIRQLEEKHANEIAGYEEREIQLRRQNDELQEKVKAYESRIMQLEDEVEDLAAKRDAAVEQLEEVQDINKILQVQINDFREENTELRKEIERLNSQIDDMRKAQVWGERQAQSIIDVTATEQEEIQRRVEAVRKLYVSRDDTWGTMSIIYDQEGNRHVVPRQKADEEWAPLEAPSLVGSESFRTEDNAADAGDSGVSVAEAPSVTFQAPEIPTDLSGADHHTANGTMDDTPVTRAEFEDLKARVERLEQERVGEAA